MNQNLLHAAAITALLSAAPALAQTASAPTLAQALALAYEQGPDLASARSELQDAQTSLKAVEADPSAVILDLTEARQTAELARLQLVSTRLGVMQNVVNAYLGLYETQQNIELYKSQVALDTKNLQVAQARLAARSGTSLDVSKAQNTLNTTQQNLANATAQLGVQRGALAKLFGQTAGQITAKAPPAPPALTVRQATLSSDLSERITSIVQARQALELAQLNVRLSDNDYTPRLTLEAAKTRLQIAQRDLQNAQKAAANSVVDAYRAAQDAYERIAIEQKDLQNAQTSLTQAQARYKSGVISQVELQTTQVALQSAQYAYRQAVDTYWKALAALSVASGLDVTGLVGGGQS
ncbi:outer membrane protein TolC [Deinobacterium chartae]|uniref:Outer membrane protein TolC n=1 Tax=Deinobacterium chartae TaxID=521158 RepID=A0A841I688_9DEIO|nr:TolC family protein [Deinobacterium chartae]MBB6099365.1 outer membrane protein TolC [Deinobacterium chartae]